MITLTIITTLALAGLYTATRRNAQAKTLIFANTATGTHPGHITRLADAAITESYCLVEIGSDADHIALCNAGSDTPIGVATDEAEAAGDAIAVSLLGSASSTLKVRTGANVSAGDFIVTNANGKAIPLPVAAGSYYIVGRTLHAAISGELVEFDPCLPTLRVVQ